MCVCMYVRPVSCQCTVGGSVLWRVTYVRSALPLAMFCELSFFCHFRVLTRVQLIAAWISTVGLVWSTLRISLTRSATGRLALHINALRFDKCSLTRSLGRWLFCLTCPTSGVQCRPLLAYAHSRAASPTLVVYIGLTLWSIRR